MHSPAALPTLLRPSCRTIYFSLLVPHTGLFISHRPWSASHSVIYSYTVFSFDPEPAWKLQPNPRHCDSLLHPSACCLHLVSIYPHVCSSRRSWNAGNRAIYTNTVLPFDPEPAQKWQPNLRPCASLLHPSACCLHLVSIYPHVCSSLVAWNAGNESCHYTHTN
jgi:hypothetical protein